jgi:hypothetical protein
MHRIVAVLFYFLSCIFCFSQTRSAPFIPKQTKHYFNWGNKSTLVLLSQYGKRKDIVMLNVHNNETTSVDAAKKVLEQTGGLLIEVENEGERLINFKKHRKNFQFDPNRIFTSKGLHQNLQMLNGQITASASNSVKAFSKFILQQIPKSARILIALHNNDDGEYSIDSYKPFGDKVKDALRISKNPEIDPDNFFLVTTNKVFNHLKASGFNAALQNSAKAKDDGSLSIYYGRRKKVYVNVEAEHNSLSEQTRMLQILLRLFN